MIQRMIIIVAYKEEAEGFEVGKEGVFPVDDMIACEDDSS